MNKLDFLVAPQTKDFVKLCRKYFEYLETLPDKQITDFWAVQLRMLSDIYDEILKVPAIDARYEADVEKFVTERGYKKIFDNLLTFIGTMDKFPDFTDLSHPGAFKVLEVSLSEILTDIYQELKDFVSLYETGTLENMNDAIAECVETFERFWGVKLLTAMRIIHINLYQNRYAESKKPSRLDEEPEELIDESDFDLTEE